MKRIELTATEYRSLKGNRRRNGDAHAKNHNKHIALIISARTKREYAGADTREQRRSRVARKEEEAGYEF